MNKKVILRNKIIEGKYNSKRAFLFTVREEFRFFPDEVVTYIEL